MLTYQLHAAAFDSSTARDAYFADREGTSAPAKTPPGTAAEHVLGSNVGLWGDRHALLDDAARLLLAELRTWAIEENEDVLDVPVELVRRTRTWDSLFPRLARVNADELDDLVRSGGNEKRAEIPVLPDSREFLANLHAELEPMARRYKQLRSDYREGVALISTDEE